MKKPIKIIFLILGLVALSGSVFSLVNIIKKIPLVFAQGTCTSACAGPLAGFPTTCRSSSEWCSGNWQFSEFVGGICGNKYKCGNAAPNTEACEECEGTCPLFTACDFDPNCYSNFPSSGPDLCTGGKPCNYLTTDVSCGATQSYDCFVSSNSCVGPCYAPFISPSGQYCAADCSSPTPTCSCQPAWSCTSWSDVGCDMGCGPGKMYQTRDCTPNGCASESQCVVNLSCPICTSDGAVCTADSACCSGNCVLDYDGSPKICVPNDRCQHDGDYTPLGTYRIGKTLNNNLCVDCRDNTTRWLYTNPGRFIVKKKGGTNKLILDKNGQLLLAGSKSSWASPNGGDWLVKSAGAVKAWLDDVFGNLYLSGGSLAEQQTISPGAGSELLIKTKTPSTYVGKIDASGNMQIKGQLGEGCILP